MHKHRNYCLISCRHHLGADWRWSESCSDEKYLNIVRLFEDRKAAVYSIHQVSWQLYVTEFRTLIE